MPIIDTHVHLLSFPSHADLSDKIETTEDLIRFRSRYPALHYASRAEQAIDNSDQLIAAMDRYGVTQALVQPTSGNTTNQQVAEAVKRHPGRLFGLVGIGKYQTAMGYAEDPAPVRERVCAEIACCIEQLGMKGVGELHVRVLTRETHPEDIARDLEPLLKTLGKYRAPLQIPTAWHQYPGGLWYGDPLFVDELAQRHPEVPIILTKMGRGIQHLFDNALMVALRNENVCFDVVGTTPAHLRTAVERIGADRIMFGTDWSTTWRWVRKPADVHTMRLRTVDEAQLPANDREWILWKTAARVFGLNPNG